MFTGIVAGVAKVAQIQDLPGLRRIVVEFPAGFCDDVQIGASISIDGVCLTVTEHEGDTAAFDIMQQSLTITTLGHYQAGQAVNAERAARQGAEIGGHPLSGHVDFTSTLVAIEQTTNNYVLRLSVPEKWRKYVFAKGYIAINGASLTIAEVAADHTEFTVWLIPETLRMTVFREKLVGAALNIEIDRQTQTIVDTVEAVLARQANSLPVNTAGSEKS